MTSVDVRPPDTVQAELKRLHAIPGHSWRKIAKMPGYQGIPPGTLSTIAKTGKVPKKWKDVLKVINRSLPHTRKRNANLNSKACARGWKQLSEYLTAVNNNEAEIPEKK